MFMPSFLQRPESVLVFRSRSRLSSIGRTIPAFFSEVAMKYLVALTSAVVASALLLVASHTHHGPVLELDSWPKGDKPYTRQLEDKLVGVIAAAAKDLQPARLGFATSEVELNRNRHSKRKDHQPRDKNFSVVRLD